MWNNFKVCSYRVNVHMIANKPPTHRELEEGCKIPAYSTRGLDHISIGPRADNNLCYPNSIHYVGLTNVSSLWCAIVSKLTYTL